jgi:hypothetical protein
MNTIRILGAALFLAAAVGGAQAAQSSDAGTKAEPSHFQPFADSTGGMSRAHGELGAAADADSCPVEVQHNADASAHVTHESPRWTQQRSAT